MKARLPNPARAAPAIALLLAAALLAACASPERAPWRAVERDADSGAVCPPSDLPDMEPYDCGRFGYGFVP